MTATSWRVIALDRDEYEITNTNEPIITYLTEGTRAHWVYPVSADALHWQDDDGMDYFSKGHLVKGIEPTDIVGMAMDAAEPELDALWDMAVEAAIRESEEG